MIKSYSSDEEFWNQIEFPRELKSPEKIFNKPNFLTIITEKTNFISIKPSGKLEKIVNNIRLATQEEIKAQKIITRNQILKEIQFNADDIKNKYDNQVSEMIAENINLRDDCRLLRKKIEFLNEHCKDQEFLITTFRIKENYQYKEEKDNNNNNFKAEINEIDALNSQLKLVKDVCKMYITKLDQNNIKIKELSDQIEDINRNNETNIEKLSNEKNEIEQRYKEKIQKLTEDFINYKKEVALEINLQSVINKKLSEANTSLKDEMKRVKIIMVSPRLRQKTADKYERITSVNNSIVTERPSKHASKLSLPQINSEKNVFNYTIVPMSNKSSRYLEIQRSNKRIEDN